MVIGVWLVGSVCGGVIVGVRVMVVIVVCDSKPKLELKDGTKKPKGRRIEGIRS